MDWKWPVWVIWLNTVQAAQFEYNLEYLHLWRLHNCSGQPFSVFDCPHADHCFPNIESELPSANRTWDLHLSLCMSQKNLAIYSSHKVVEGSNKIPSVFQNKPSPHNHYLTQRALSPNLLGSFPLDLLQYINVFSLGCWSHMQNRHTGEGTYRGRPGPKYEILNSKKLYMTWLSKWIAPQKLQIINFCAGNLFLTKLANLIISWAINEMLFPGYTLHTISPSQASLTSQKCKFLF